MDDIAKLWRRNLPISHAHISRYPNMGHCLTGSALGEQIDQIDKCGVSMNPGAQDA